MEELDDAKRLLKNIKSIVKIIESHHEPAGDFVQKFEVEKQQLENAVENEPLSQQYAVTHSTLRNIVFLKNKMPDSLTKAIDNSSDFSSLEELSVPTSIQTNLPFSAHNNPA